MKKYRLGILAEYIVLILYKIRFYNILHQRRKTYVGEIDLIALRGKQLVFIEVKARKNGLHEGIISQDQQMRIKRAAELFLAQNLQYTNYDIRFDLAVIRPYHWPLIIKNAW
ncbi:MAG: YraN family protein [Rickettsiaceae bacterium]|nr:YraN family protein [Rickettsiaceae bacterium]MDP4832608.1 YraN family protein [Rickettsiaceae bacterium]MDP5020729.1 YraN family protein [Rickettsiaceae bacterium]MDP5082947.1 YraN family protein [Rickettsiaceae bacterium]